MKSGACITIKFSITRKNRIAGRQPKVQSLPDPDLRRKGHHTDGKGPDRIPCMESTVKEGFACGVLRELRLPSWSANGSMRFTSRVRQADSHFREPSGAGASEGQKSKNKSHHSIGFIRSSRHWHSPIRVWGIPLRGVRGIRVCRFPVRIFLVSRYSQPSFQDERAT